MRITDVRAVQPAADNSPPDWRTSLGQILVAIDTDQGLTGYGVGGGGMAGIHVVRTVLRDLLLEQSPEPVEDLAKKMYEATLPFGRKGLAIMATSGVDLALWDLRGKAMKQSVVELLGGSPGRAIPAYATVWGEIEEAVDQGYKAFKLHVDRPHGDSALEKIVRRVEQARSAAGPDGMLMLDAWMKWDVEFTLAVAGRVKDLGVAWIEEPLPPDDRAGYCELIRRKCPIPIAGGEHEFTAAGFAELIDARLHQVLQPDVCWCGGLTHLIEVYRMAGDAGIRVCPHRGAEIWSLHAIAALDPDPLAESGRPWMTWVNGQPEIVDGFVTLPEGNGFGIRLDEANLKTLPLLI